MVKKYLFCSLSWMRHTWLSVRQQRVRNSMVIISLNSGYHMGRAFVTVYSSLNGAGVTEYSIEYISVIDYSSVTLYSSAIVIRASQNIQSSIVIECASVTHYSSVTEYSRLRHVLLVSNGRGPYMRHTLLLSAEFLGAGRAYLVFLAPHQNSIIAHRTCCTCDISTTVSLQSLRIL